MVLQFREVLLARLTMMTLVYVAVLSMELFVLDRLLKVSSLRVEVLSHGNLMVGHDDEDVRRVPTRDFHKRQIRSFRWPPRPARVQLAVRVPQHTALRVEPRDEVEELERRYLGR